MPDAPVYSILNSNCADSGHEQPVVDMQPPQQRRRRRDAEAACANIMTAMTMHVTR